MNHITIRAHGIHFLFPLEEEQGAWYDLDQALSESEGAALQINADREVYACLTLPSGEKIYGTIGDAEDEVLSDNFGIQSGEEYVFYDHPETENQYI